MEMHINMWFMFIINNPMKYVSFSLSASRRTSRVLMYSLLISSYLQHLQEGSCVSTVWKTIPTVLTGGVENPWPVMQGEKGNLTVKVKSENKVKIGGGEDDV